MRVWASRPESAICSRLSASGIEILPTDDNLGQVERYILSRRVVVDYRTSHSFLDSILDKTLFASAIELGERFEIALLIVEGDYSAVPYRAFHPQAVRGALSSMPLVYGLSVVVTPNLEESAALIAMMARQEQGRVPEITLTPKRKATDLADMQRRVIEMLPGCGLTVARNLLQHFGSIARIVRAREEDLCTVRGVGPKTAAAIHQVLHAEYDAIDTERNLEDAIAAAPELLFEQEAVLVARQHALQASSHGRDVVDLVFLDQEAHQLLLVELKRGKLEAAHEAQLQRYLAHAVQSPLLRDLVDRGAQLRGVLATATPCDYRPSDSRHISVRIVSRDRALEVLRQLRHERLEQISRDA